MIARKILVAYDGSDLAKKALSKAMDIGALDPSIEIQAVHVIKLIVPMLGGQEVEHYLTDEIYRIGEKVLEEADQILAASTNPHQTALLTNQVPSSAILEHARDNNCDLIIIGSRGLGGLKEFLGSVSHAVVQKSPVPVLIMK